MGFGAVGTRVEAGIAKVRRSPVARRSVSNAVYGVAEYLAQPVAMVIAAPLLVHRLGLSQYGIWMLVSAVVGSVGTLSGGFGDATVKYVSMYRGRNERAGVVRTIRGTITINAVLGMALCLLVVSAAPFAIHRIFKVEPEFTAASIFALRVGGLVLFIRSIESVFVSTLRAYERYGPTVKVNVASRSATIVAAVVLAEVGCGVPAIMIATLCIASAGMACQAIAVRWVVGPMRLLPVLDKAALAEIASFGCFSWLQGLAGVIFSYADRLLVGAMLGTSAVAYYSICVQAAQPIHGLTAAAFNFFFPHMSARHEGGTVADSQKAVKVGLFLNAACVAVISAPLIFLAKPILGLWMGKDFASHSHLLLSILACSFGILAINVVPHYTLLALGEVRFLSFVNVLGGVLSLLATAILLPLVGLPGAAIGRLIYGPVVSLNFLQMFRTLRRFEVVKGVVFQ